MVKDYSNSLLIIIDDVFPNELSSFRNVEFNEYLSTFSDVLLLNISKREVEKKAYLNMIKM